MYVTGGIGSGKTGEAFTTAYDLPNLEAYSESCAAISLVLFALAMQKNELNAEYGAVIERILYNSLLSTTSIDGRSFYYENPLEIHMASVNKETSIQPKHRIKLPIRHRLEVFGCSCCPPNISRLFARMGDVFFSKYGESFVINQLGAVAYKDDSTEINITTDYPNSTGVVIDVEKCESKNILIRIPEWCEEYTVSCEYAVRDGYICVPGTQRRITLDLKMTPYFLECNPLSRANNGRVAVCYGPVVYCLERIDNEYELNALTVDTDTVPTVDDVQNEYGMRSLMAKGYVDKGFKSLYRKTKGDTEEVTLKLRPYWTFANREETDMLVWIRKK